MLIEMARNLQSELEKGKVRDFTRSPFALRNSQRFSTSTDEKFHFKTILLIDASDCVTASNRLISLSTDQNNDISLQFIFFDGEEAFKVQKHTNLSLV